MDILYALFFGAGTTAFVYGNIGRRVGYGNTREQAIFLSAVFIIAFLVCYSIIAFTLHIK